MWNHACLLTDKYTMHVIVDKTRQFYHKICGDPVEENAFVLFIDITVMMKAANQ